MTSEEREKVIAILIDRMLEENSIAWSNLSIDYKTELYITFYLHKYSDEKLIAELLGVDNDK
jgi:hypothetical protein